MNTGTRAFFSGRRLQRSSWPLLLFLLALNATACAARQAPAVALTDAAARAALRTDLAAVFDGPEFDRSLWGVVVQSLDTGETLFARNPTTLMMPASNMKILTLAASIERLGWDHTFETRLVTSAPLQDGALQGDLIVVGGGDPSIGGRVGDEGRVLASWADALWAAGLRSINGRLIGDDDLFDDDGVGEGWSWDDLALGYAAPVGALSYDENAVELAVTPGAGVGDPAVLTLHPSHGGLAIDNQTVTQPAPAPLALALRRPPDVPRLVARGTVPQGMAEFVRTVSVVNPTDFFLSAFHDALLARGITVSGPTLDIDLVTPRPDVFGARLLLSHRSPPLSELALPLMKVSRNLYGETLLKTLGTALGQPGSARTGREALRETVEAWGIPPDSFIVSDGSGLSRYNYAAPEALVAVLRRLADDERFEATLPVAGRDGTLENRLQGTPAEDNARAKGGSMSNVRALSGYLRTRDRERLVFSIVANNFDAAPAVVDRAVDLAVARLAAFSRSTP